MVATTWPEQGGYREQWGLWQNGGHTPGLGCQSLLSRNVGPVLTDTLGFKEKSEF